ncbi:MAG TPA: trypsin-like peptidase domain-containing protein [Blastocatellia bacterium]|nr:trypsin-like peptidase domain-containing protein [Blastocatellia bacterium]
MKERLKLLLAIILLLILLMPLVGDPVGANGQLRDTFRRVRQSVVVVRTVERTVAPLPRQGMVSSAGLGSGVLISDSGKVLTAAHVVQAVDKVFVEFADGQIVTARVISSATNADVALLQLDSVPQGVSHAKLGDSDQVEVGDEVFVVGAPYGLSLTLTVGHVSGRAAPKSRLPSVSAWEFFQTDAAINGGNSGSPMFDWKGEVIGIVSNILSRSGGFEGIGFAATSKMARILLEQKPFWSGMEGILVQGDLAGMLNLQQPAGFLVQRVAEGSPGWRLGIRPGTLRASIEGSDLLLGGDVMLSVNGIEVLEGNASSQRIYESLSNLKPGEQLVARVLRAGQVVELSTEITQ